MKYNPLHIIQGWVNTALKTNNWNKVSAYRMAICKTCPQYITEGEGCKIPNSHPCCKACGCPLKSKTRSNSNCPLSKW